MKAYYKLLIAHLTRKFKLADIPRGAEKRGKYRFKLGKMPLNKTKEKLHLYVDFYENGVVSLKGINSKIPPNYFFAYTLKSSRYYEAVQHPDYSYCYIFFVPKKDMNMNSFDSFLKLVIMLKDKYKAEINEEVLKKIEDMFLIKQI